MPPRNAARFSKADYRVAGHPSSIRRFASTVPHLRELLQSSDGCERELMLQAAMRRTLRELSDASSRAAGMEGDPSRAKQFRAMAKAATELARTAPY